MKYIRQFMIISLIAMIGEALNALLPLPVPGSIYGIIILFTLLMTGAMKVDAIRETSAFLIQIMPVMFIPAATGLLASFDLLAPKLSAYAIIIVVSTVAVMAVSGLVTQALMKKKKEAN